MSEYMAAEIWIGSRVSPSLVADLCTAITQQSVSVEWGDVPFAPGTRQNLLEACRETEGVLLLWLCDDQARWGAFETLEQFLRDNQIAYTRRSEGRYEYDPERVEFRPEQGMVSLLTNTAGEPVVPVSQLAEIDAALIQIRTLLKTGSQRVIRSAIQSARHLLRERLPPVISPLEPFEIEEGADG